MKDSWKLLSDPHIKEVLESEKELSSDFIRLVLTGMFYRVKRIEAQSFALQSFLMASGLLSEEELNQLLKSADAYIEERDSKKYEEVEMWKSYGISFQEMVKFNLTGRFHNNENE